MNLFKKILKLLVDSFNQFLDDKGFKLSAALSYYTVFAMAPMLLVMISVVGIFFGRNEIQTEVFHQIQDLAGTSVAEYVEQILLNAQLAEKSGLAATIGIVTLLVGATGVFVEMQDSINFIWSIKSKPQKGWLEFLKNRLVSFSMIIGLGFLLIVALGINALVQLLSSPLLEYVSTASVDLFKVINNGIVFLVITILFAVVFKVLPDGIIRWKEALVGAVFTAFLFSLGKFLIGFYLGQSNLGAIYGASASVVILLSWVYYSSIILYYGAVFTKVYAEMDGVEIVPKKHAVRIIRQEESLA